MGKKKRVYPDLSLDFIPGNSYLSIACRACGKGVPLTILDEPWDWVFKGLVTVRCPFCQKTDRYSFRETAALALEEKVARAMTTQHCFAFSALEDEGVLADGAAALCCRLHPWLVPPRYPEQGIGDDLDLFERRLVGDDAGEQFTEAPDEGIGPIGRFFLEAVRPARGRRAQSLTIWSAYRRWCAERSERGGAVSHAMFGKLARWPKERAGGVVWYLDAELAPHYAGVMLTPRPKVLPRPAALDTSMVH